MKLIQNNISLHGISVLALSGGEEQEYVLGLSSWGWPRGSVESEEARKLPRIEEPDLSEDWGIF